MLEFFSPQNDERFKKLIAVMIAVITTLIAVLSFLQGDAASRDDAANRDSKRYSLESFGRQVSGDAQVNYDYNSAYQGWYELNLLAAAAETVGDGAAARRYTALSEEMLKLSPMLQAPYFDPATGRLNVAKYESDVYVVDNTALFERFAAASIVKDAWDYKANTYIVHLTLLAVALFLFGLSLTISSKSTRLLFTVVGLAIALFATGWAGVLFARPVNDLRQCKSADGTFAIDTYAQGVGLAYQNKYQEAIAEFDKALVCKPTYVNALIQRGDANSAVGNYGAAAADYEQARAAGDTSGNVAGNLGWVYYLLGRFDDAAAMNRTALTASPGELWIQYDLALSLLADNQLDKARAEYQVGMELAAKQVADAKAAHAEPPSYLWWGLEDAANSVDDLQNVVDAGEGSPPLNSLSDPGAIAAAAADISSQLKSLSVGLEFTGPPPVGELTAVVSPFTFATPIVDDAGNVVDYEPAESFPYGTDSVSILYDYQGMTDGQEVVFKVYIDGEEDPSWRFVEPWSLGESGSAEKPLSYAYSNTQVLSSGEYVIEVYVDSHLAQTGTFVVEGQ